MSADLHPMTNALRWADRGVKSFAIAIGWDEEAQATDKRPLTLHGHLDATTDPEVLRDQFVQGMDKLRDGEVLAAAIRPGPAGYVVMDPDVKHHDADGNVLDGIAFANSIGVPTDTWTVDTASGGEHRVLRKPDPTATYSNAVPPEWELLLDVRADSGWIVAPGTVTPWGSWTEREPWDPAKVKPLPASIAALLTPVSTSTGGTSWRRYDPAKHDADLHPMTVQAHALLVKGHGVDPRLTTYQTEAGREPWLQVTRPGKGGGISATVGYVAPGLVYVFSTAWPDLPKGAHDILTAAWEAGLPEGSPLATAPAKSAPGEHPEPLSDPADLLRIVHADQVQATRITYMWQDRIPLGAVTVAPGEEGIGKSTVLTRVSADATRGTLAGDLFGKPSPVIVVAPEDQLSALAVPRLREAGADLTLVKFIAGRVTVDGGSRGIEIPRDLDVLGRYVDQIGARLVWIDSLVTTMPEASKSVSYKDVASILRRLGDFAEAHRVAVVAPWHLNKAAGNDTALRMMDSRAFRTAARSVLLFVGDPERPGEGLIALDKANGADLTTVPAIRFRLRSATFTVEEVDEDTGEIVTRAAGCGVADFIGEEAGFGRDAARELLVPKLEREDDPKRWLRDLLTERGETNSAEVLAAGKEAGHSRTSIQRAAHSLGVQYREAGIAGKPPKRRTFWRLPSQPTQSAQSAYIQTNGLNGLTGETHVDLSGSSSEADAQSARLARSSGREATGEQLGLTEPAPPCPECGSPMDGALCWPCAETGVTA